MLWSLSAIFKIMIRTSPDKPTNIFLWYETNASLSADKESLLILDIPSTNAFISGPNSFSISSIVTFAKLITSWSNAAERVCASAYISVRIKATFKGWSI